MLPDTVYLGHIVTFDENTLLWWNGRQFVRKQFVGAGYALEFIRIYERELERAKEACDGN